MRFYARSENTANENVLVTKAEKRKIENYQRKFGKFTTISYIYNI